HRRQPLLRRGERPRKVDAVARKAHALEDPRVALADRGGSGLDQRARQRAAVDDHLPPRLDVEAGLDEHGRVCLDPRVCAHVPTALRTAVRIRGPSSVTATVCSKCAESEPSDEEIDHSSACMTTSGPPAVIIGSIASVIPGSSSGPRPGEPKFGICGSSWYARPTPCPTRLRTTEKPPASTTVWVV